MSELSPTTGGVPRSPGAADYAGVTSSRKPTDFIWTTVLVAIVGLLSLLLAEQLLAGWLALGERANIPRSNLNFLEIVSAVGLVLWGGVSLWTALGFWRAPGVPSMAQFFEGKAGLGSAGVFYSVAFLLVIGVGSLLLSEQILTGWLALGERANIPRSDKNQIENIVMIAAALWGLLNLRTAYGFIQRDRRTWAWAQWIVLGSVVLGTTILLSGMFDIHTIVPAGGTLLDNLGGTQALTAPGLLLVLSALGVYRFLSIGVDTTAAQHVRNRLAKTPGAGAIIGVLAIMLLFSLASDLFLEQRSLAGILATNISRGIVAIGITFLMISGEFDLSVGSVFGVGALIFLLTMTEGLPINLIFGALIIVGVLMLAIGASGGRRGWIAIGAVIAIASVALLVTLQGSFTNEASVAGFTLRATDAGVVLVTTVIPAFLLALLVAAGLGAVNGIIMIATGIPSFIVTLGTLLAYRAILLVVVADGRILRYADYRLPPPNVDLNRWVVIIGGGLLAALILFMAVPSIFDAWRKLQQRLANFASDTHDFRDFYVFLNAARVVFTIAITMTLIGILAVIAWGQFSEMQAGGGDLLQISFFDIMNGQFSFVANDVNLRAGVLWWGLLVLLFQFILTQTPYGNHVQAVGGNPGAARAQGIDVNRVKVVNFMICSVLAALAGIISVGRLANVDPLMGEGLELEVIAASVIGGALLSGGYGSIVGALLGVLIFGMLQTGLVLIGVDSRAFSGVVGIIIIIAVVINTAVRRERR
jgi:ribose/xylose/arabinose/galactoside ABC-type transport system permease subunit